MRVEKNLAANDITKGLGFCPDEYSVTDSSVIAAALRRAVTINPSISRTTLISSVADPLISMIGEDYLSQKKPETEFRSFILNVLLDLTAIGDVVEIQETDESLFVQQKTVYYPGYPSFVTRNNGDVLLLGSLNGYNSPIPWDIQDKVVHRGPLRIIPTFAVPDARQKLIRFGLNEIPGNAWISTPPEEEANKHLVRFDRDLDNRNLEGNLQPQRILAGEDVTYYSGRWRAKTITDNGRFIGRITQAYGSPAWAYLDIAAGQVLKSRFFGSPGSRYRACDEAWRLQSAIDSVKNNPQRMHIKKVSATEKAVCVYSPLPSWLERRWVLLADKRKETGSFSTYRFHNDDIDEEIDFAHKMFWLDVSEEI